jgi:hypothetical protein
MKDSSERDCAPIEIVEPRLRPAEYPLTDQDLNELKTKRGFTDETIQQCQFGSVKNQEQLTALGFEATFAELASTVLIPFPGTQNENGEYRFQLHRLHLPDTPPLLYVLERPGCDTVVITESPFKAAAAFQLGYPAIGLNGIWSFINRVPELRQVLKRLNPRRVVIHLDTERSVDGTPRDSLTLALAYAFALESKDQQVIIAELPDKYLVEHQDSAGKKFLKADLDGALAAGLTATEWATQISAGFDFWSYPVLPELKAEAMWLIEKENIFRRGEQLKKLIENERPTVKTAVFGVLAEKLRGLTYDTTTEKYDDLKLKTFEGELKELAKGAGAHLPTLTLRKMLLPTKHPVEKEGPPTPKECGLSIRNNRLYRVGANGDSSPFLAANVVPSKIESGTVRYLRGPILPLHKVTLLGRPDPIEVAGALFDVEAWETAGRGTITIPGAGAFKQFVDHKIAVDKIQVQEASLDRVMWAGTYLDAAGKMVLADKTQFAQESEECCYHDVELPDSQTNQVFECFMRLYRDSEAQSARVPNPVFFTFTIFEFTKFLHALHPPLAHGGHHAAILF